MPASLLSPTWFLLLDDVTVTPGINDYPATVDITVEVRNAAGQLLDEATIGSVTWGVSDPDVATAVSTGPRSVRLTAVGQGAADVTAFIGLLVRHIPLQVLPPAP